jgi:F420H(2)-dependent quinone reductase
VRCYTRTWTREFNERGIRFNTLSPGPIDTPIMDSQAGSLWRGKGDEMTLNIEGGLDGEYVPSRVARVRKQVEDYEASDGVEGATLEGRPVVILTSVGAQSGKVRKNPIMRIVDGERYVAVASNGGAPTHPSWYTNLITHPAVRLQDGATVKDFHAREVSGDEKQRYWAIAEQFWPHFPEYRRLAAGRDIPIMVLKPIAPRK